MDTDEAAKPAPARRSAAHVPPMSLVHNGRMHNNEDATNEAELRARAERLAATALERSKVYDQF
jgi:hypothetical protein